MRPDPALAKANVWPVAVDDSIAFGPYRAVNIQKSWKSTSGVTNGPVTSESSRQTWSFDLGAVRVFCTYRAAEVNVATGAGTFGSNRGEHMQCDTIRGSERGVVSVQLTGSGFSGSLRHASHELTIASRHELEGAATSTFDPAGYDVKEGTTVFASIQTINSPTVWMTSVEQPKQELAAAALVALYHLAQVPRAH